jgi:light-regulated signal transduction histidine kinase (bacteriophytochrome)
MIDISKPGIVLIVLSWALGSAPTISRASAATPAGGTRSLNINLFGKSAHLSFSVGALGIAVILTLAALLAIAAFLAFVARRRAKQLEAANRELENEIKERQRAEDEVRRLNAGLERRVEERTAELADAIKQLEAFSYSVSHDLKAPLRAISGFSKILQEDYGPLLEGEAQAHLNSIVRGAQRMGQLIEDLLAFSRLGRNRMSSSSIDMDELARSVLDNLQGDAPERKVECSLQHLPPTRGDRAMIRQVLVNLLSNAIKFTKPAANALIEVGCSGHEADLNIYYVKDNGAGFDMRYSDKLFGVFQRLHSVKEFEGTGVGLAIVQRIVQRHGGRVWAQAKVNEGATFHFTLPSEGMES